MPEPDTAPQAASPRDVSSSGRGLTLERRFEGFGDRAAQFVRSLVTLSQLHGGFATYDAEPNLRIVRAAFGKWAPDLLLVLASRRRAGFGELRRQLPGISARVLSGKLRSLESAGLVERTVIPSRPPRPEYALSDRAQALVKLSGPVLSYLRETTTARRRPPRSGPPR